jgi:hypothetical protein
VFFEVRKGFAILLGAIVLTACTVLPKPFEHTNQKERNSLAALIDGGAIRVEVDQNLPEFISKPLSLEAVKALVGANIPASADPNFYGKYVLKGFVNVERPNDFDPEKATFVWNLVIKGGSEIVLFKQTIQGDENGWLKSDPELFTIIAKDAAHQIAKHIQNSRSLTKLTMDSVEISGQRDNIRGLSSTFYLSDISGTPGDGNRAILRSLKFLLNRELGPTVSNKEEATYLVRGTANVSPPLKGRSDVAITWLVFSAAGKELGKVTQNNSVAAGSLDARWGLVAFAVAKGALQGIRKIVSGNNDTQS